MRVCQCNGDFRRTNKKEPKGLMHRQKQVQTYNNELIVVINVLDGPHIRYVN